MDQLGTGVDWECRTGAPPPLVCHSPILLIHVSTRPQSGRIAVVWPSSAVASVVAARAAVGRAGGYVGYFREVRGAAGAGAVDPRAAPMAHSSLRRAWAREIAIRCDAMRVWGRTGLRPRLAKCPDHQNRPPWIPSPAGPIPSWGHQHTS